MKHLFRKTRYYLSRRWFASFRDGVYYSVVSCLRGWPLPDGGMAQNGKVASRRIAYFIWQYPVISQTFVQREVAALVNSGRSVFVVSDIPPDCGDTPKTAAMDVNTACLENTKPKALRRWRRKLVAGNPILCLKLFLYVIGHDYHGYKCFNFDRKLISKAVSLAAILRSNQIDHVHSPWADNCALIALLASRLLQISYSVQARAHDVHRKTYLRGQPEKLASADFVITNTAYNSDHIKTMLGVKAPGEIHVIHNGINLSQFKPKPKDTSPSIPTLLSVGRLIDQKGFDYLLHACKLLRDRGYVFRCEILGGPENPLFMNHYVALKKLHRRLRLENCVFFFGTQQFEEVLEKYREADIFVLPCVIAEDGSRDITPNVLIEAMAMQLPVISTTVTGIPEIVENEVSGILVPPNEPMALADAIVRLLDNAALRRQLGRQARKRIEDKFDIEKNIRRYIELFSGSSLPSSLH